MTSDYYVYCWTGPTGRYVGKGRGRRAEAHVRRALTGSRDCPRFYAALRKYGAGRFSLRYLSEGLSSDQALVDEVLCIYLLEPAYNIAPGGTGAPHTQETKDRISAANTNPSAETRAKRAAAMVGRVFSDSHRARISAHASSRTADTIAKQNAPKAARMAPIKAEAVRLVVELGLPYKRAAEVAGCSAMTAWNAVQEAKKRGCRENIRVDIRS